MTFDSPDSNVCAVKRDRSNTPLQALTLMNDVVFVECAQALGRRVAAHDGDTPAKLNFAWKLCLGREPNADELQRAVSLVAEFKTMCANDPAETRKLLGKGKPTGDPAETAAWIALARTMMNLDEFVTRE
jgi:hypothetical protein